MAEKKKWVPTKMFLQWCLSYLLISVIALTLLLASGYRYLDVLRDNLEYTNGIQLDMTRVWLDQKVMKEKLLQDEKLETIAITCGFGSLRSFLRIFKQYEGVIPTQYRELHGKKEETTNENI